MTDSFPAPSAPTPAITDHDAFLRAHALSQPHSVMRYPDGADSLWIKRAGPRNPAWRYHVLAALARLLRAPVLQPVPNPGGHQAIRTEVQRLRELAAHGLRVPAVLAANEDGFAMRDLGGPGLPPLSLGNAIEAAMPEGAQATLALWLQGLAALQQVHEQGMCLSQAFARNMVCCPDGAIGFIDFEDDPAAHMPLALCQLRDALCYVHSTALFLAHSSALADAKTAWQAFVQAHGAPFARPLAQTVARMQWVRHLPQSRRLGRDMQRLRAAYDLLSPAACASTD